MNFKNGEALKMFEEVSDRNKNRRMLMILIMVITLMTKPESWN
jgi:hypothetical protein